MYIEYDKKYHCLVLFLFISFLYLSMYIFIYFSAGVGHRNILHLSVWGSSPRKKDIEMGETPQFGENCNVFISIIKKNLKKINISTKVKINKHKCTVIKRCSKKNGCFKN